MQVAKAGIEAGEKQREWDGKRIPMGSFGKDHLSTLLYIESLITDGAGDGLARPHQDRMRQEPGRPHRGHGKPHPRCEPQRYASRLADGTHLFGHDDWDCVDDLAAEGLAIRDNKDAMRPTVRLTDYGRVYAAKLREHLGNNGRSYKGFVAPERPALAPVPPPEKPMAVGDVWYVHSSRKGKLVLRVTRLDETWLTGDILDGTSTAMNPDNIREVGEDVTIRRSHIIDSKRMDWPKTSEGELL